MLDFKVVRLGGLEPPTKSLGNSCSFHLSYSRRMAGIIPCPSWVAPRRGTRAVFPFTQTEIYISQTPVYAFWSDLYVVRTQL